MSKPLVTIALLFSLAAMARPAISPANPPEGDLAALNLAQLWCGECLVCIDAPYGHEFFQNGYGPLAGGYHSCLIFEPCVHQACGIGANVETGKPGEQDLGADYAASRNAILAGGVPAVAAAMRLVEMYPDRVSYNASRGAIQITANCNHSIIAAHLELRHDDRAAMTAAMTLRTVRAD